MKIKSTNITDSVNKVRELLKKEKKIPSSLKIAIEVLILLVTDLSNRLRLNSYNSSKSPSTDPNRERKSKKKGNSF